MPVLTSELWLATICVSLILSWVITFRCEMISPAIPITSRKVQPWYVFVLISVAGIFLTVLFMRLNAKSNIDPWIIFIFAQLLIYSSVTDLFYRIIPNRFLILVLFFWLSYIGVFQNYSLLWNFIPAIICIASFLIINVISSLISKKNGFGSGDIKLLAVSALLAGDSIFWIIMAAVLLGGTVSVILLAAGLIKKESYIPFAPFVLLGAIIRALLL